MNWFTKRRSVAPEPKDSAVAVVTKDATDAQNGTCREIMHWRHEPFSVTSYCMLPGSRIALGDWKARVRVWDLRRGRCIATLRCAESFNGRILAVVGLPDGKRIAAGSEDWSVRVFDMDTGECLRCLTGLQGPVKRLYLRDGRLIATALYSANGYPFNAPRAPVPSRSWDYETGQGQEVPYDADEMEMLDTTLEKQLVERFEGKPVGRWCRLADGRVAAAVSNRGQVVVFTSEGHRQHELLTKDDAHVAELYALSSGVIIQADNYYSGEGPSLYLWDLSTGRQSVLNMDYHIEGMCWVPEAGLLLCFGGRDGYDGDFARLRVWDVGGMAHGPDPLHALAVTGACEQITNPEVPDSEGFTPLMLAAMHGQVEAVRQMLKQLKGGDIDAVDSLVGRTAFLHAAFQGRSVEVLEVLVNAGHADLHAKDKLGRSAMTLASVGDAGSCTEAVLLGLHNLGASLSARDARGMTALAWACRVRNVKAVEVLMKLITPEEIAAGVHTDDEGINLLMHAAAAGHEDIVRTVLELGVLPPQAKDAAGRKAVDHAEMHGCTEVAAMLGASSRQLLGHIRGFVEHSEGIASHWKSISQGKVERELQAFSGPLVQQLRVGDSQPVASIDDLYQAATAAQPTFDEVLKAAASPSGSSVAIAPLKAIARIQEKATDDYADRLPGPPISWVYDVLRAAVTCADEDAIIDVIERIKADPRVEVLRLKNRFARPTPAGFRDININIRIQGHVTEVQIHHAEIRRFESQHHSHSHYEYTRSYFKGDVEAVAQRLQALHDVGSSGWEDLGELVYMIVRSGDISHMLRVSLLLGHLQEWQSQQQILKEVLKLQRRNGADAVAQAEVLSALADSWLRLDPRSAEGFGYAREAITAWQTIGDHPVQLARAIITATSSEMPGAFMEDYSLPQKLKKQAADLLRELKEPPQATLAMVLRMVGETEENEDLLQEALEIATQVYGENHVERAELLVSLAKLQAQRQQITKAVASYDCALGALRRALGNDHVKVAEVLEALASIRSGDALAGAEKACAELEEAVRIHLAIHGPQGEKYNKLAHQLGIQRAMLEDPKRAETMSLLQEAARPGSDVQRLKLNYRLGSSGIQMLCGETRGLPLRVLVLESCHMGDDGAVLLAEAVARGAFPSLEELILVNNDVEQRGCVALARAIGQEPTRCSSLRVLDLPSVVAVAEVLRQPTVCPNLRVLKLSSGGRGEGESPDNVAEAWGKTMTEPGALSALQMFEVRIAMNLNIFFGSVGASGVTTTVTDLRLQGGWDYDRVLGASLGGMLRRYPQLTRLSLSYTFISVEGMKAFAEAAVELGPALQLQWLELGQNQIKPEEIAPIAEAFKKGAFPHIKGLSCDESFMQDRGMTQLVQGLSAKGRPAGLEVLMLFKMGDEGEGILKLAKAITAPCLSSTLRVLDVGSGNMEESAALALIKAVGAAKAAPALQVLRMYCGIYVEDKAFLEVAKILQRQDALPKLMHLGICGTRVSAVGIKAVHKALQNDKAAPSLREFDLETVEPNYENGEPLLDALQATKDAIEKLQAVRPGVLKVTFDTSSGRYGKRPESLAYGRDIADVV